MEKWFVFPYFCIFIEYWAPTVWYVPHYIVPLVANYVVQLVGDVLLALCSILVPPYWVCSGYMEDYSYRSILLFRCDSLTKCGDGQWLRFPWNAIEECGVQRPCYLFLRRPLCSAKDCQSMPSSLVMSWSDMMCFPSITSYWFLVPCSILCPLRL